MALEISGLKKQYAAPDGSVLTVLDVPEFAVASGEQVALVGSSGSGKTTLLHAIAGIIAPDAGSIRLHVGGEIPLAKPAREGSATLDYGSGRSTEKGVIDIPALTEARRDVVRGRYIGYVFQTHHLLPGFTAMENVVLGMSFTGRSADKAWARHLLEEVGLGDRLNYVPSKLSIGQQQRVAVARALANRPRLVLADEPTGALDEENAQHVLDLMRKLCAEVGASLLLVTHDLSIASQLSRQVDLAEINRAARRKSSELRVKS